jgi:hypothetical protein
MAACNLILQSYQDYVIRNVSLENYTCYSTVVNQFGMKGRVYLEGNGKIENVTAKCWTIGTKTIMSTADLASSAITVNPAVSITFSGCDALNTQPRGQSDAGTPGIFPKGKVFAVDRANGLRLLVVRPDGRTLTVVQGSGATAFALNRLVRTKSGVYLLQLINDGGASVLKAVAGY